MSNILLELLFAHVEGIKGCNVSLSVVSCSSENVDVDFSLSLIAGKRQVGRWSFLPTSLQCGPG